jgi:transposase
MRCLSRREELFLQVRRDPEKVVDRMIALEEEIQRLKAQLAQNSLTSNKPPSSDGPQKPAPKSLRKKTGRKPGGQPGHPGRSLEQIPKPDEVIVHALDRCSCGCCQGVSLRNQPVIGVEKRQVFDLPPMRLVVTEHQAQIKRCPVSGKEIRAEFPVGVSAPAQYGTGFQSFLQYLHHQHFIPPQRLSQLCIDLLGQAVSPATVLDISRRLYTKLKDHEDAVVEQLCRAPVVHCDETGLRVNKDNHWLHVVSTFDLTFYGVHAKRGGEAIADLNILPRCGNWAVHDCWGAYFNLDNLMHALCNPHLLRELQHAQEHFKEPWAGKMSDFLLGLKHRKDLSGVLEESEFENVLEQYHNILREGRRTHPPPKPGSPRRAQSKPANLLARLEKHDAAVLAFCAVEEVPFSNNQAEQDIRMNKVKQKISGCFRSLNGARYFARIRGYISTCRKQGQNIWQAIKGALAGEPFIPVVSPARS